MPQDHPELLDRSAKTEGLAPGAFVAKLALWKAAGCPDGFGKARVETKE